MELMNRSTTQKGYINYLKAICIILVVIGHCLNYYNKNYSSFNEFGQTVLALIYAVHVPTFFVISGFLVHKQDVAQYYKKKVFRIAIPYFIFSLLKIVYNNFISSTFLHTDKSIWRQILDILISGDSYWFAYTILLFFVLTPLIWHLNCAITKLVLSVFIVINCIISIFDITITSLFQLNNFLFYFPFFLLGYLISIDEKIKGKILTINKLIIYSVSILLICTSLLIRFLTPIYSIGDYFPVAFLLALSLMFPLFRLSLIIPKRINVLSQIGQYSYQILLLDAFFKAFLFLILNNWVSIWVTLLICVLDVMGCFFVCLLCKKIPIVRTLLGIKKG